MSPTHYVDVMLREATISHDLHARLLTAVHFQINAGHAMQAAWPDWKNTPGEFGLLFRAFGNESGLAAFLAQIKPLTDAGLIRPFPVGEVPEVAGKVAFVRDRSLDKFGQSSERRAQRRNQSVERFAQRPTKKPHFLMLRSITTGKQFPLYVVRKIGETKVAGGARYGLGEALPDF